MNRFFSRFLYIISVTLLFLITPGLLAQSPTITNSIVVGGVTHNSAKFWIRLSGFGSIGVELSKSETFSQPILSDIKTVTSEANYAGIVEADGLEPLTKYYYRAIVNGSPVTGKLRYFKTFPIENSINNFTFAFGSCQQSGNYMLNPSAGNVYKEIIKHDPKFFLQIGDWTYPDTTDMWPLNNNIFSADYSLVRKTYQAKFDSNYQMELLLSTTPIDYVYDDHDYTNNNSSALTWSLSIPIKIPFIGYVISEVEYPPGARENSIRGYKENMPAYPLVNESRGIYHKFTYGNAEFFALDLRSQRSSNLNPLKKNSSIGLYEFKPDSNHSILGRQKAPGSGETQLEWFLNSLRNSTADWKFIISSVPFNKAQRAVLQKGIEIQDSILGTPDLPTGTRAIFAAMELADKWAGFSADTDTLLNFIEANNIKNVIVLSGDSHTAALDDGANAGLPEIMAGGLDITNSKILNLFTQFRTFIWNKGGQGLTTQEFNNAFGKVTVFGKDSVHLALIDEFGTQFAFHSIKNVTADVSDKQLIGKFELFQNYPNPFNPRTIIEYTLPQGEFVSLKIYDVLGREVETLVNEYKQAGSYNFILDVRNFRNQRQAQLSSGIYFYKLSAGNYSKTMKMILLR